MTDERKESAVDNLIYESAASGLVQVSSGAPHAHDPRKNTSPGRKSETHLRCVELNTLAM